MPHIVALVKQDRRRFEQIPADVQSKTIFIDDASLPIEEGDIIERQLPNGLLERYEVADRGFWDDHYQVKVKRR